MEDKVKLIEFSTIDDFADGCNNFSMHFWNEDYRKKPCFIRFRERYPDIESELTKEICEINRFNSKFGYSDIFNLVREGKISMEEAEKRIVEIASKKRDYPKEKLFDAYRKMAELVNPDDKGVIIKGKHNTRYLIQ